jgi:hypothetical protein
MSCVHLVVNRKLILKLLYTSIASSITTAAKAKAMVTVGDNMHMIPQTMAQELEDGAKQAMNKMKGKKV